MNDARKNPESQTEDKRTSTSGQNSWLALLGVAFLVAANLCLLGPAEIFLANRDEFKLGAGDVLPLLIGLCILVTVVITPLAMLAPRRHRHRATAILLAVGVLLWIQGSFLRWGYGEFTGVPIDWSMFSWHGWVDGGAWVVVLTAAFYFSKRISRVALFLTMAFILIQLGAMTVRTIAASDGAPEPRPQDDATGEYEVRDRIPQDMCQVSRTRNVFHIILDAFQTDVFMELVEEDNLSERFDGFVAYPENMSTGSRTVLSIPAAFSTNVYDGTETESEYFNNAMKASLPSLLHQSGYVVNLLPHVAMTQAGHTNYFTRSPTYASSRWVRRMETVTYLIDIGMFRQFPHFAKRAIYNNQNWRLSGLIGDPPSHASFQHRAMFSDYMNRLEAMHDEPAYHFLHFMSPHPPFVTLADGSYAGEVLPHTRENYKHQARYIVRSVTEFIEKLKELDLYDSSIILLHGDHGTSLTRQSNASEMEKRMNWVSAMLLLKPERAHGALTVSSAQTSLTDVPATVLSLLGVEHTYPGESIVELDPQVDREREAVFVTDKTTAAPVIHQWRVTGSVVDSTSWRMLPPRKVERKIPHHEWGDKVRFGIANVGEKYLTSGWSTTAGSYSWNDGYSAELTFGFEAAKGDLAVGLLFYPYIVPGKAERQRIRISIDGRFIGEVVCTEASGRAVCLRVSRELVEDGRMVMSFGFPDAVSPRSIGEGDESRVFAIKLVSLEADLYPYGCAAGVK